MERQPAYSNLWTIELHKLTGNVKRKWTLIGTLFFFGALPWLTLRNFEERFASFSWYFLDDSYLNFVIDSTANNLSWIMIITLLWIYILFFSEESNLFFRKKNKLFIHLITCKSLIYMAFGGLLMGMIWFSTIGVYWFWCWQSGTIMESGILSAIGLPMCHLFIRTLFVFPLMLVLFLSMSKKWSFIILMILLFFSAFLILPFHFHFNVQRPEVNLKWIFHSLLGGCVLIIGLILYYRYISKKTYVFP